MRQAALFPMPTAAPIEIQRDAVLDHTQKYRYRLSRWWGDGERLLWVMLNPSTADASIDDPTIRRCIGFTYAAGFEGFDVVNLFAWRATDPRDLRHVPDPCGKLNAVEIERAGAAAALIVFAWGAIDWHPAVRRARSVMGLLGEHRSRWRCLGMTERKPQPRHPLFVPKATSLQPFEARQ